MAVYAILEMKVSDTDAQQANARTGVDLVGKYGGEFLARRGTCEVVEGDWRPSQLTMIRFDDRAAIQRLLDDEEYKGWLANRRQFASSNLVILEGAD